MPMAPALTEAASQSKGILPSSPPSASADLPPPVVNGRDRTGHNDLDSLQSDKVLPSTKLVSLTSHINFHTSQGGVLKQVCLGSKFRTLDSASLSQLGVIKNLPNVYNNARRSFPSKPRENAESLKPVVSQNKMNKPKTANMPPATVGKIITGVPSAALKLKVNNSVQGFVIQAVPSVERTKLPTVQRPRFGDAVCDVSAQVRDEPKVEVNSSDIESIGSNLPNNEMVEQANKMHHHLERRTQHLIRRLRRLQGRQLEYHTEQQLSSFVEYQNQNLQTVAKSMKPMTQTQERKPDLLQSHDVKNLSTAALVNLVRKLQSTQSSISLGQHILNSAKSASLGDSGHSVLVLDEATRLESQRTAEHIGTNLRVLESALDSDATESSSGGESCEECDVESEKERKQKTPLHRRAEWKWATDRAAVAARWTWLQAQVSDLEYRIRQQSEIYRRIRESKGCVKLGDPLSPGDITVKLRQVRPGRKPSPLETKIAKLEQKNEMSPCNISTLLMNVNKQATKLTQSLGNCFSPVQNSMSTDQLKSQSTPNSLNGVINSSHISTQSDTDTESVDSVNIGPSGDSSSVAEAHQPVDVTCQAARCLPVRTYRKRKLLSTAGLHLTSRKAARLSAVKCGCYPLGYLAHLWGQLMDQSSTSEPTTYIQLDIFDSEQNLARILNGDTIDGINLADYPVTYAVYEHLLKCLDDFGYNIQNNLPKILREFNADFNLPKKISNLTRKIQRDITKKISDSSVDQSWKITSIIPYLNDHVTHIAGFAIDDLQQTSISKLKEPINVGRILRLRAFRKRKRISWSTVRQWMKQMFDLDSEDDKLPTESALCSQWDRLFERKCRDGKKVEEEEYRLPRSLVDTSVSSSVCADSNCLRTQTQLQKSVDTFKSRLDAANETVSTLREALIDTSAVVDENKNKLSKYDKLKHECDQSRVTIQELKTKVQVLKPRNVNRRIERKDQKIYKLNEDLSNKNADIRSYEHRVVQLTKNLDKTTKEKIKAQKQSSYHKLKSQTCKGETEAASKIELLKEKVTFYESENAELREKADLMNTFFNKVTTFHGGKYNDSVREVYAVLLSMNVGVSNVERIVRLVLEKLGNVEVDRLPKKTFAETMLVEAKLLAQMQAADAMLASTCNTLHTDGTKRSGVEYGGVQVGTDSGQYSLGISELVRGDTDSFFEMIQSQLNDMAELLDDDDADRRTAELIKTIKNTMTDRHIVNTSLKSKLEVWREQCLPLVVDNFETLPVDVKRKMIELNDFKCNLHVLVNLGTQAESALKVWEQVAIDCTDSSQQDGKSTVQFIRATTKLCVPGADEKSGYGLLFDTYLKSLTDPVISKLHTFHGHRINIVFSLGAAVYYHHQQIANFVKDYFSPDQKNKLVLAVEACVNSSVYIAGCRALGIIDKLLTGPLWRQIEEAEHILDLNNMWLTFKNHMSEYAKDASDLIQGKILYPKHTNSKEKDEVFEFLFKTCDEEMQTLTREALEVCCLNFLIIIQRQLADCLPGGKFHEETNKNKTLRTESSTVKATNIVSERDFASLDRLRREKPNANTIALEGMLCYSSNNTLQWLDSLDSEKKAKVMENARKKAPDAVMKFRDRKANIKRRLVELLETRKEEKMVREKKAMESREKATNELIQYGGLWKTVADIDYQLEGKEAKQALLAVKTQLRFRKVVLKSQNKKLLSFSKDGEDFSLATLVNNLKSLVQASSNNKVVGTELTESTVELFTIKSKEERERCMTKHKDEIYKKLKEIENKQDVALNSGKRNRKPKRKRDSGEKETQPCQACDCEEQKPFVVGETVAVAFDTAWYPGNVISVASEKVAVNFLHPTSSAYTSFRWPTSQDSSEVDNVFVFDRGFDLIPKDNRMARFEMAESSLKSICAKFEVYKAKYFE
ncbi:hypothetical protein ScPMuIL_013439 [Solemya velum]